MSNLKRVRFNFEKLQLSYDVVSESDKSESERNGRVWIFVKGDKKVYESLFNYIKIDNSILFIYKNNDTIRINGLIEYIKPQDNGTLLLILNCLYAPETLEFINSNDRCRQ